MYLSDAVGRRAVVEKVADDVVVALLGRLMKRRITSLGHRRHQRSILYQETNHCYLSEIRYEMGK